MPSVLDDVEKTVAAVSTTAAGGYGFWQWVIRPLRARLKRNREFRQEVETLIKELPKVKEAIDGLAIAIKEAASSINHHAALSCARSRAVAVSMDAAMWESDEDGRAVWLSPRLLRLLDLGADDARGFGWKAGLHPDDIALVDEEWSRAVRDRRIFDLEYRTRQGVKVRGYAYTIRDDLGNVRGFIGTLTEL